jgi:predicted membrane channel-forming protein YqfA (hemolysin III family)
VLIFLACGMWLVGLGIYFLLLRPALLPEDPRYIGATLAEIRTAVPGLERWLRRVFTVMGGFMTAAGVLTLYVAATAAPERRPGAGGVLAITGLLTVVMMSAINFAIDSDFRWLLLAPALLWLAGLAFYHLEQE